MKGEVKVQRIQKQNRTQLQALADVVTSEELLSRVPRLALAAEGRSEKQAMIDTMSTLGHFCRTNGWDPSRQFQHVATIDVSVWHAILEAFAKYDEETGELVHDGLLYVNDPTDGKCKLNKPFFYALVDYLDKSGYNCDMRGKIKVN